MRSAINSLNQQSPDTEETRSSIGTSRTASTAIAIPGKGGTPDHTHKVLSWRADIATRSLHKIDSSLTSDHTIEKALTHIKSSIKTNSESTPQSSPQTQASLETPISEEEAGIFFPMDT